MGEDCLSEQRERVPQPMEGMPRVRSRQERVLTRRNVFGALVKQREAPQAANEQAHVRPEE